MKIATFNAKCKKISCQLDIDAPLLSDFSYGTFIYSSIDGKEIKYYYGLDCEVWQFIDEILIEPFGKDHDGEIGTLIQKIIGLVADKQNQDAYFTQAIYCPKCHSKVELIDINNKTGFQEYESLTFNNFLRLTDIEKIKLVNGFMDEFQNKE